jgi:hypothetical protein
VKAALEHRLVCLKGKRQPAAFVALAQAACYVSKYAFTCMHRSKGPCVLILEATIAGGCEKEAKEAQGSIICTLQL